MRLNAKQIAAYTGGQFLVDPIDASALMTGITWDSREVRPGWLYVALPGERVDGHAFVEAALRAGAAGGFITVMVPDLVQPDDEMRSLATRICRDLFEVRDLLQAGAIG